MNVEDMTRQRDVAYEAHRRAQQRDWEQLPWRDKLDWLEEMHRLALRLQAN